MDTINRTLQLISIQHELSMTIGLDLNLDKMLGIFMQRAQHRLSLSTVMVIHNLSMVDEDNHSHKHICLSFPTSCDLEKDWLIKKACELYTQQTMTYSELEVNGYFYYLFVIPHFGVLVFERKHQVIEAMVLEALKPLLAKLATSCLACIEHQNLITEIVARKEAEQLLIQQSLLDPLTDLPNRKMLNLKLVEALINSSKTKEFGAVFFIDLDRFKVVNDSLGHSIGDEVLKFVGQRLSKCINQGDTLARMGGDEFVLLANHLSEDKATAVSKAKYMAEQLAAQLSKPLLIDENNLSISISTGISLFPLKSASELSAQQQCNLLLRNADLAMYQIKHANRNSYGFFRTELQSYSEKRTQVEKHLRAAIDRGELEVHYQPLVDHLGHIIGAEALLRWRNPQLGQVSPAEFIPIAEESGLIIDIGNWVLTQICQLLPRLVDESSSTHFKYISINVSPRQFNQPNFVQEFVYILEQHKIDSNHIRIEITEGVAIDDVELAIAKIKKLKSYGVECMLDDFGSGYSSLSYLNSLPLKTIKIDRSFVSDIDQSKYHQLIVNVVTEICNYSQSECIAEGVETEAEFQYLVGKGVNAFQGYYFHRPMPVVEFLTLLR